jgi:hypothetical protein
MIDVDSLTEDEAFRIYHLMAHRFGWVGTFFTRGDANTMWRDEQDDTTQREMPDEMWELVQQTWGWRKYIEQRLCEIGWDMVRDAVREAMEESK